MMLRKIRIALLLSLSLLNVGLFAPAVSALQVTGLYTYRVAVSNDGEAERIRAFNEALAGVIVKVTGSQRWLQEPSVQRSLSNASRFVEAISYASEVVQAASPAVNAPASAAVSSATQSAGTLPALTPTPVTPQPVRTEQRYVNVTFAASLINELLIGASVPIWDSNRPSVLVWMVLQNAAGERRLLTADGDPEIVNSIRRFGMDRGLPVIFPVLDFEDRSSLPVDSLWNLDEVAIKAASRRYGADTVLSGRLHFTAGGELVGLWQFIFQNQATVFDGFDSEVQAYLAAPLDRITTQLANYFAVVPVSTNQNYVRMQVEGINGLKAYSSLLTYVRNLGLVRSVATAHLDGSQLELVLGLQGDAQQLLELIALDRDLLPIASSQANRNAPLHYRWTR